MYPKLLSIIITGRNDFHMGNFKYRLTTCINYIARNLKTLGRLDDVEILVTDWNSDIPLSKVVALTAEAAQICRFVYVPPKAALSKLRPDQVFNNACAINVSLRRSHGKFLVPIPADLLIPGFSLRLLFELLDGRIAVPFKLDSCQFMASIKVIPYDAVNRELDIDGWDRYLLLNGGELRRGQCWPGLGISALCMMHSSLWHACRGYDERFSDWGWGEVELTMRISEHYPWIDLMSLGITTFDMEHREKGICTLNSRKANPHIIPSSFAMNDENWGMGEYELDIQTAENVCNLQEAGKYQGKSIPIETWDKTSGGLLAEMTGKKAQEHIQLIARYRWCNIDKAEWESLSALAWYSLYRSPRNYLEFGIHRKCAAVAVAAANPSVEIYGIDSWQAGNNDPDTSPDSLSGLLHIIGYQGYFRLVPGNPFTAFKRLRDSLNGSLWLDLALVRGDMFGKDAFQQLSDIIPYLAPGGMIVFTSVITDNFRPIWDEIRKKFGQFTYLQCRTGKTGLILAASLSDRSRGVSPDMDDDLQVDFGNAHGFAGRFYMVYRIVWTIKKLPWYAKRIWRLFFAKNPR